jgi:ABC-2 type transport system ATP-binding protein
MLKQGSVVALDTTPNLLAAHGGLGVRLRLDRAPALPGLDAEEGGWWRLGLTGLAGLEPLLARLREEGVVVEDMEILRPDLEEVFLRVMQ